MKTSIKMSFTGLLVLLREKGHEVISPAEIEDQGTWDACLRADLREMLTCEAIVVMTGWYDSRGSRLEVQTAIQTGMPFYRVDEVLH